MIDVVGAALKDHIKKYKLRDNVGQQWNGSSRRSALRSVQDQRGK